MSCRSESEASPIRNLGHSVDRRAKRAIWSDGARALLGAASLVLCVDVGVPLADDSKTPRPVFDHEMIYQVSGGEIRFTVPGDLASQPNMRACMRWKPAEAPTNTSPCEDTDHVNLSLRRTGEVSKPSGFAYAVTLPDALPGQGTQPYGLLGIVPAAELEISNSDPPPKGWRLVRSVGITSRWLAAVNAIVAILVAGALLNSFASYLNVPGPETRTGGAAFVGRALRGFSIPLRIISTASGWASLSQLQIVLWTFVIGAGAIYVMTLNGSLIPISPGALALLGIAGGAAVLSEVKNQQSQSASAPPGVVTNLALDDQAGETDMLIGWYPPPGAAPPLAYLVQYADPAGVWYTASREFRATKLRIVGLKPSTSYAVRVLAGNAAGTGPEAKITATTAATAGNARQAPAPTGLRRSGLPTATTIPLGWDVVPNATYEIDRRPHEGDEGWTSVARALSAAALVVSDLAPSTEYDFRVRTEGTPPGEWSRVGTFTTCTQIRTPRWSDVVTDVDRPGEIDVTRVQMLFFTVISAVFVTLSIIRAGVIPEIDSTYVSLMGISNGLYVTAKFVRP